MGGRGAGSGTGEEEGGEGRKKRRKKRGKEEVERALPVGENREKTPTLLAPKHARQLGPGCSAPSNSDTGAQISSMRLLLNCEGIASKGPTRTPGEGGRFRSRARAATDEQNKKTKKTNAPSALSPSYALAYPPPLSRFLSSSPLERKKHSLVARLEGREGHGARLEGEGRGRHLGSCREKKFDIFFVIVVVPMVSRCWRNSQLNSARRAVSLILLFSLAFYILAEAHIFLVKRTVRRGEASSARAKEPGQGARSSSRGGRRQRRRAARRHHAARGLSRGDAGEASCRGGSGAASRHCAKVGVERKGGRGSTGGRNR